MTFGTETLAERSELSAGVCSAFVVEAVVVVLSIMLFNSDEEAPLLLYSREPLNST